MAEQVKVGSLCALGGTAPNPVFTALKYFRDEFEEHVVRQEVPGGYLHRTGHVLHRSRDMHRLPGLREGLPDGRHHRRAEGSPRARQRTMHQVWRLL